MRPKTRSAMFGGSFRALLRADFACDIKIRHVQPGLVFKRRTALIPTIPGVRHKTPQIKRNAKPQVGMF